MSDLQHPPSADAGTRAAPGAAEAPQETGTPNEAGTPAPSGPSSLRKAWSSVQRHPLGVVAALGAATALVEVELAVGILTGIGATALLVHESGPEARQRALAGGKRVLERARSLIKRKPSAEPPAAETSEPPPAAAA